MKTHSHRGDVTLVLVLVLGGAALLGFTKPWKLFTSKPPIAQLQKAQADLDAANAKAAAAEKALADAKAADEKAKQDQLTYAQQMVHGTAAALSTAPQSPEVQVAQSLTARSETALAAAIGQLPPALAAQIEQAVSTALAAKDHEIATLNATLAQRDADLAAANKDREQLKVQIPVLSTQLAAANKAVETAQVVVSTKQEQVNAYAAKAAAADAQTFGLQGLANGLKATLAWVIGLAVGLWLLKDLILPSLAQEFPSVAPLQWLYRTVTSITSAHIPSTSVPPKP